MTDPVITESYRMVFGFALDQLVLTLKEAQAYLGAGQDLAAIGTLTVFDEQAEDMKAALRIFRRSAQTDKRRAK